MLVAIKVSLRVFSAMGKKPSTDLTTKRHSYYIVTGCMDV